MQKSAATKNTPDQTTHVCVSCFRSLGVPTKHKIYAYLKSGDKRSVTDIVSHVGLTQPTVSYHLKNMQEDGLLKSTKLGKEVYYSIKDVCPHTGHTCVVSQVNFQDA